MCSAEKPFRKAGTGLGAESLSTKLSPGAISGTLRQTIDLGNTPGRYERIARDAESCLAIVIGDTVCGHNKGGGFE